MVLTGGRKGFTGVMSGFKFMDGRTTLEGPLNQVEKLTHWMAVMWQAYPEGSKELEALNGKSTHPTGTVEQPPAEVQRGMESGGEGAAQAEAPLSPGPDRADADGPAGVVPEGDGSGHAGQLKEALMMLDSTDDSHWTGQGLPSVEAVSKILGRKTTRAEIQAVAPDLTR